MDWLVENHDDVCGFGFEISGVETTGKQGFFRKTGTPPASGAGGVREKETDE
jgi:hypothetical protein